MDSRPFLAVEDSNRETTMKTENLLIIVITGIFWLYEQLIERKLRCTTINAYFRQVCAAKILKNVSKKGNANHGQNYSTTGRLTGWSLSEKVEHELQVLNQLRYIYIFVMDDYNPAKPFQENVFW